MNRAIAARSSASSDGYAGSACTRWRSVRAAFQEIASVNDWATNLSAFWRFVSTAIRGMYTVGAA